MTGSLAWWQLPQSEFAFAVVQHAGVNHQEPDTLLQLLTDGTENILLEDTLPVLVTTSADKMDGTTTTIFV